MRACVCACVRVCMCVCESVFVRTQPHVAINDNVCASEYVQLVGCMYFTFLGTCERRTACACISTCVWRIHVYLYAYDHTWP